MDVLNKAKAAGAPVEKVVEAVKGALPDALADKLSDGTPTEGAGASGGTGLAAGVAEVLGTGNAAEEAVGGTGLTGRIGEVLGTANRTAAEGAGGLMGAAPAVGKSGAKKTAGGLF
jgi:hypothetical protein